VTDTPTATETANPTAVGGEDDDPTATPEGDPSDAAEPPASLPDSGSGGTTQIGQRDAVFTIAVALAAFALAGSRLLWSRRPR
jgi:hypothetical protein